MVALVCLLRATPGAHCQPSAPFRTSSRLQPSVLERPAPADCRSAVRAVRHFRAIRGLSRGLRTSPASPYGAERGGEGRACGPLPLSTLSSPSRPPSPLLDVKGEPDTGEEQGGGRAGGRRGAGCDAEAHGVGERGRKEARRLRMEEQKQVLTVVEVLSEGGERRSGGGGGGGAGVGGVREEPPGCALPGALDQLRPSAAQTGGEARSAAIGQAQQRAAGEEHDALAAALRCLRCPRCRAREGARGTAAPHRRTPPSCPPALLPACPDAALSLSHPAHSHASMGSTHGQHPWAASMGSTHGQHPWAAPMGSTHGQHPWAASMGSTHGQHPWAAPMGSTHGQHPWAAPMGSTHGQHPWAASMGSTHGQHPWAASMGSTHGQHPWAASMGSIHGQHPWAAFMGSTHGQHPWAAPMGSIHGQHPWAASMGSIHGQHPWAASMGSIHGTKLFRDAKPHRVNPRRPLCSLPHCPPPAAVSVHPMRESGTVAAITVSLTLSSIDLLTRPCTPLYPPHSPSSILPPSPDSPVPTHPAVEFIQPTHPTLPAPAALKPPPGWKGGALTAGGAADGAFAPYGDYQQQQQQHQRHRRSFSLAPDALSSHTAASFSPLPPPPGSAAATAVRDEWEKYAEGYFSDGFYEMNVIATNDMDEIYEDPEYGEMGELEKLSTKVDESEDTDDTAASVEAAVKQKEEIVAMEAAAVNGGDGVGVNTFAAAIVVEDEAVNEKYMGVEAVKGDILVKGSKEKATAKGRVLTKEEHVEGYETREGWFDEPLACVALAASHPLRPASGVSSFTPAWDPSSLPFSCPPSLESAYSAACPPNMAPAPAALPAIAQSVQLGSAAVLDPAGIGPAGLPVDEPRTGPGRPGRFGRRGTEGWGKGRIVEEGTEDMSENSWEDERGNRAMRRDGEGAEGGEEAQGQGWSKQREWDKEHDERFRAVVRMLGSGTQGRRLLGAVGLGEQVLADLARRWRWREVKALSAVLRHAVDAWQEHADMVSGRIEHASLTLIDASLTLIDASLTLIDASLTLIDASLTLIDASLTLIDASLTLIDASLTLIDASLTLIDASLTLIDASITPMRHTHHASIASTIQCAPHSTPLASPCLPLFPPQVVSALVSNQA
ncbi:unnamed protein product [Closterium sp. Naga37s-1]|nr:unnamed protein product [Closterium sp. Naga37s-1]